MYTRERKTSRKLSEAPARPARGNGVGWAGIHSQSLAQSGAAGPGLGEAGGEGDLPGTRTPPPAAGRAPASRYLDQPQNVTAVGGGGRADHEFSHFLLLLFFPLRTKPLYLNSRRRWFLIRLPGASSSQSGWHHDPANLGEHSKNTT